MLVDFQNINVFQCFFLVFPVDRIDLFSSYFAQISLCIDRKGSFLGEVFDDIQ